MKLVLKFTLNVSNFDIFRTHLSPYYFDVVSVQFTLIICAEDYYFKRK